MVVLPLALAALLAAEPATRPTLRAGALKGPIDIDGRLEEIDWSAATPIDDLTMMEPVAGGSPTGRTEVRVLANDRDIVIGVRCFDPDPARIVTFTKERDGDFEGEDHLLFVIDPFQDGRSGYVFSVNAGGARSDGLVVSNGERVDESWDGVWEAATERNAEGWSVEIRIPVFSVSFAKGLSAWGFNVERRIQRNQETGRWAAPSRDTKVYQTSRAGLLTDLPDFTLGLGLSIRPALLGGVDHPSRDSRTSVTGDASVDITKRLGPNLTAALTLNTDFAETEADTRQPISPDSLSSSRKSAPSSSKAPTSSDLVSASPATSAPSSPAASASCPDEKRRSSRGSSSRAVRGKPVSADFSCAPAKRKASLPPNRSRR